jgi:hypothetical protein
MNDNGVNFHGFEKNDVARDAHPRVFVRRIHKTPAVFDDKGRAAEPLDVRKRFEERIGFSYEILHASFVTKISPQMKARLLRQFHFDAHWRFHKLSLCPRFQSS